MRHRIITIILMLFILAVECKAADLMLPQVYDGNQDISGWLMSEKLDGVRGYWDGKRLLSKNGTTLHPPEGFVKNFPDFAVEGEIWGGRNTFEKTVSAVMKDEPHDGWLDLKFLIFDVPSAEGGIQHRLDAALKWFAVHPSEYAVVIEQKIIANEKHLEVELSRLAKLGGEGLIIRDPHTPYIKGRNNSILKVKSYYDSEALVVGHIAGKGRNKGRLGALLVELPNKTRFKIGTGFTDQERINPPSVSEAITFKYYGFYKSGIPKFPSFLRVRGDNTL